MKRLRRLLRPVSQHWVGDGFPVRTVFAYSSHGEELSPFLMLDYAGPTDFPPATHRRGVGEHPHRGFETVTIVYAGQVEHRDSSGGGGVIGPGDVQWMTAASGLVHDEFHGSDFAERGGRFQMAQLWVNLPAASKMTPPRYQGITSERIPVVPLAEGAGRARVIAGELRGAAGPADTVTPILVLDLRLAAGHATTLPVPDGFTATLVVLEGRVRVEGREVNEAEAALFERDGADVAVECIADTTALLLAGEPIDEPIVGHGPFVMNTIDEIHQAIEDFNAGRMGRLPG